MAIKAIEMIQGCFAKADMEEAMELADKMEKYGKAKLAD